MFQANDASTQPTNRASRLSTSSRSFPYWSPSFPISGVVTAATSMKPVSTHVTHVVEVCRSSRSAGSAGTTIVCRSAYAVPAKVSAASVTLCCRS